ncbi:SDR family NAD(P)-dependent oxidoreductase [Rhizobium jaguaris]|nr:SDR family NAD(P)-dependent oxidoreductase [Rhizobium jaguaris]
MDRTAIVTGGARGIGKACAIGLAKAGFDIALVDLLEPEMQATASAIRAIGRRAIVHQADVSDFARAGEIVSDVEKAFGRVDFLLNNAGASNPTGILEITEASFDRTIAINLKSCFNYIHHAAPIMLAQGGGRITSISSLNALSGGVTAAVSKFAYASAKAGILGMTRALAKELGPSISINAICPGVIQTEIDTLFTGEREAETVSGIALGRLGCADDVANLVVFLATSEPLFMTGQALVVDGFQFKV